MTEVPGRAARTPGSLLRGLVSTVLTLTSLALKRPVRIVGMLRFVFDVQRRCRVDVSTMDTGEPTGLPHRPTITSRTISPSAGARRAGGGHH